MQQFVIVTRATIKGSIVVAIVQGVIGGVVFWALGLPGALLWGVLMGAFSLIPAVGTGLVWVPVAIYLFVTGAVVEGLILAFCGMFVIGMVDNILRPILVGRDTRIRSEEHTSELQSLMRLSYAVFCLKKKNNHYYPNIPSYVIPVY